MQTIAEEIAGEAASFAHGLAHAKCETMAGIVVIVRVQDGEDADLAMVENFVHPEQLIALLESACAQVRASIAAAKAGESPGKAEP